MIERKSILQRTFDAVMESRMRRAERELAMYRDQVVQTVPHRGL